jgi:molybdopterin converting factor small subunit
VKVLFYGRLAEAIGPELEVEARPGSSVAELRERLAAEHPGARQSLASRRARTCIGDTLVSDDHVLGETETVEFLPPVSGG